MVLEQVFQPRWFERRPRYAFYLGVVYTTIGIISARLIFPSSTALMAVAFTSLLLIPSLNKLLEREERVEMREKKLSLKLLFKDHKDIFEVYFFLFLGIFCAFGVASVVLSPATAQHMFSSQLKVTGISGFAFLNNPFALIVINNLLVLLVCLVLSFIYGSGAVLFLTWNASVWGVTFGYIAQAAAQSLHQDPFQYFLYMITPVLPHLITEASAYLSAAIVGGVVSKAVLKEKFFTKRFHHILTDALLLLILAIILIFVAAFLEVYMYPVIQT